LTNATFFDKGFTDDWLTQQSQPFREEGAESGGS